jgi:hypothetical protein
MDPSERQPTDPAGEALRALEDRLDRATEAAQRLAREAADSAARAVRTPPAGWAAEPAEGAASSRGGELDALVSLVESVRDLVPAELRERMLVALRELLLAVRALIDWYLERFEQRRRSQQVEVEDIPIS